MEIREIFEQFGLEGKKADVYLSALELGGASTAEIAKKAEIKRTTCYEILSELSNRGFIGKKEEGKKSLFFGEDPEIIKNKLENQKALFFQILPGLKAIYSIRAIQPKVRFYEGKEGLREVYEDTLKYSAEIVGFASEDIVKVLSREWAWDYMRRRSEKNIVARFIMPKTEFMRNQVVANDQKQLRTSKLVNPKKYPFSIEIDIYGFSKVALISSKEKLALIIEATEVHNTFKSIFNLLWENLPEVEKDLWK
jgi:sugar-specific transcriptional regulator TrmB